MAGRESPVHCLQQSVDLPQRLQPTAHQRDGLALEIVRRQGEVRVDPDQLAAFSHGTQHDVRLVPDGRHAVARPDFAGGVPNIEGC